MVSARAAARVEIEADARAVQPTLASCLRAGRRRCRAARHAARGASSDLLHLPPLHHRTQTSDASIYVRMYIGFSATTPLRRCLHLSSRLCSHLHLHLCLQVLRAGNALVRGARWAAETAYAVRCLASLSAHADGLEQLEGFVPLVCSALRRHARPRHAHAMPMRHAHAWPPRALSGPFPREHAQQRHAMLARHAPRRVSYTAPHTARALPCMCAACALHRSHCMCTACALHVSCCRAGRACPAERLVEAISLQARDLVVPSCHACEP